MPDQIVSETSLREFIRLSLQVLRTEQPAAFAAMKRALGQGEIYLGLKDGEGVLLSGGRALRVRSSNGGEPQPPAIFTSRRAILRLADGELSVLDAIYRGELEVIASSRDLLRLERALGLYLRGAVRCPSFPRLLERFRETVR